MKFYSSVLFKLIVGVFLLESAIMWALTLVNWHEYVELPLNVLILSIFMSIVFFYYLKRPLDRILKVARDVQSGKLDTRTGVSGSDEVAIVARGIDQMSAMLKEDSDKEAAFNEELRATNDELQRAVDDLQTATAEQQAINAELEESKAELEKKYLEMERFYNVTMGREKRVIELKEENKRLKEELKTKK